MCDSDIFSTDARIAEARVNPEGYTVHSRKNRRLRAIEDFIHETKPIFIFGIVIDPAEHGGLWGRWGWRGKRPGRGLKHPALCLCGQSGFPDRVDLHSRCANRPAPAKRLCHGWGFSSLRHRRPERAL